MDIQRSDMDGFETTKKYAIPQNLKRYPFIAMTAHAMSGNSGKTLISRMDDHITKPIDPDALRKILRHRL